MSVRIIKSASKPAIRIRTVRQIFQTEPYKYMFTAPSIRALIFNAEDRYSASGAVVKGNGLLPAIIRIGRRVYLDLNELDRWILSHKVGAND